MPHEYKIDRTSNELWVIDDSFVTRLTEYVSLEEMGRYLYYDGSNAIDVTTDFRSRLTVHGHFASSSAYFGVTTIHFENAGIIVFDLPVREVPDTTVETTKKKKRWPFTEPSRSLPEFNTTPIRATRSLFSCITSPETEKSDYIFTRTQSPRRITPGPIGYCLSGYNLHIIGRPPTSYVVYDINGDETQEPMVKMNLPPATKKSGV